MIKSDKTYHPIAKVTKTSGLKGDVRLKPLSRFFDDYISDNSLLIGYSLNKADKIIIEMINGIGKKRKFKFFGFDSSNSAKTIVGKTIFVQASIDAKINWISKNILNFDVYDESNSYIGSVIDVLWLPMNDAYIIKNKSKEFIIPIISEIIKKVDLGERRIIIKAMDGLLN